MPGESPSLDPPFSHQGPVSAVPATAHAVATLLTAYYRDSYGSDQVIWSSPHKGWPSRKGRVNESTVATSKNWCTFPARNVGETGQAPYHHDHHKQCVMAVGSSVTIVRITDRRFNRIPLRARSARQRNVLEGFGVIGWHDGQQLSRAGAKGGLRGLTE